MNQQQTQGEVTMTRNKFNKVTRRKAKSAIRPMLQEGLSRDEIAARLNDQGVEHPNGKWTAQNVQSQLTTWGMTKQRRHKVTFTKIEATEDDSAVLADLIIDSAITDTAKIRLLKALRNKGAGDAANS